MLRSWIAADGSSTGMRESGRGRGEVPNLGRRSGCRCARPGRQGVTVTDRQSSDVVVNRMSTGMRGVIVELSGKRRACHHRRTDPIARPGTGRTGAGTRQWHAAQQVSGP